MKPRLDRNSRKTVPKLDIDRLPRCAQILMVPPAGDLIHNNAPLLSGQEKKARFGRGPAVIKRKVSAPSRSPPCLGLRNSIAR